MDFTFFASDADSTRRNWKQVLKAGSSIVDLSYALEGEPGAVVRAPWIERQLGQTIPPGACSRFPSSRRILLRSSWRCFYFA